MESLRKILVKLGIKKLDWRDIEYFDASWEERISLMADLIPIECKSILDIGCGNQLLKKILRKDCYYVPLDYIKRSPDTLVFDLNQKKYPSGNYDLAFMSGCMEYLFYPRWLVEQMQRSVKYCLMSYCITDDFPNMGERENNTWQNHFSEQRLVALFAAFNFKLIQHCEFRDKIFLFKNISDA